jgi:hypothetical protein
LNIDFILFLLSPLELLAMYLVPALALTLSRDACNALRKCYSRSLSHLLMMKNLYSAAAAAASSFSTS